MLLQLLALFLYRDNVSIIQNGNLLYTGNGVVAVGNHKHSSLLHQLFQSLPDEHLAFRVKTGCWFIQNEQGRIFQKGTCNRDALCLTSTQTRSTFPDLRHVPLWQLLNKFLRPREFRCLL